MKLIEVRNLNKNFGGLTALFDVSFDIFKGEIVGVIGPNGAGKTTLFNCLSGFEPASQGELHFKGENLAKLDPNHIVKLGLARTFQTTRVFKNLSVIENVMVGRHSHLKSNFINDLLNLPKAQRENRACRDSALYFLQLVGLVEFADFRTDQLTLSQARRMELARALATGPELLLLDEPGAGLDDKEREDLTELILEVHKRGITLMMISHEIDFVMNLCMEIIVLNFGKLIAKGKPVEVLTKKEVLEAYLGDHVE
jgi:branched-chain amino acid transport system ATP-binding protein